MALHPVMRPLGLIFAFSGIVQSIVWFILSLLSILQYAEAIDIPTRSKTHNGIFLLTIKALYFDEGMKNLIVTRNVFFGFTIFYFVFSIMWFALSVTLFSLTKFSKWEPVRFVSIFNFVVVGLQCTVDMVFMALVVNDYNYMLKMYNQLLEKRFEISSLVYCLIAQGFIMTLAARGFLLWVINFANVIYNISFTAQHESVDKTILYNIPIDAYKEYPGDRNFAEAIHSQLTQNWHNSGYDNEAYARNPYDNHEQSTSFNQNYGETPSNQQLQQNHRENLNNIIRQQSNELAQQNLYARPNKAAKAGPPVPPKPSTRGPPIPFPDYTPPQSPTHLRSVIKQNSSYY